jgi:nucleoside-diphosphate-sugar epimerase
VEGLVTSMLEFEVHEIRGTCPVYKKGDKIVIADPEIVLEKTDALCTHALSQTLGKFDQKRCAEAGVIYVDRRDWDVKTRLLSSIAKAKRLLGYEPQTTFEDGLKKVHEWFVANWADIARSAEF